MVPVSVGGGGYMGFLLYLPLITLIALRYLGAYKTLEKSKIIISYILSFFILSTLVIIIISTFRYKAIFWIGLYNLAVTTGVILTKLIKSMPDISLAGKIVGGTLVIILLIFYFFIV
jgi:hypothetical protein